LSDSLGRSTFSLDSTLVESLVSMSPFNNPVVNSESSSALPTGSLLPAI